ncbi:RsfA family transcriptional regulator [Halobacillus sp. A5]|uniref:RsfA family transcriptional regulator n=1 Tax=Halobacillus sp. A5 TaxID=2880263 RepID=UPI0020A68303|nr:RsfA family transcriptional regulator [Halobacillus sp. A5]MCP3026221.1 RsfA family transcriptional regulator [Halobacillus sp. A5]
MDAPRQDAWKKEEDELLADTVLQYIREGHTQLEAFQEVARQLNRTPAACGFRWNATVRKNYQKDIRQAKQERTQHRHALTTSALSKNTSISLDDAILFLKEMKQHSHHDQQELQTKLYQLSEENVRLKNQIKQWEEAWSEIDKLTNWVKNRYQSSS